MTCPMKHACFRVSNPEYQAELDWADAFVPNEVEPLDHILGTTDLATMESALCRAGRLATC
jgi:hypothetical protein